MYSKSCCTTPHFGVGGGVDKMLKFLCDGQGTVRGAILYVDRFCSVGKSSPRASRIADRL